MIYKKCCECALNLRITEYNTHPQAKDGRMAICKTCRGINILKARRAERLKNSPDKDLSARYPNHVPQLNASFWWKQRNREQQKAYSAAYYLKNRARKLATAKAWRERQAFKHVFG